MAKIRKVWETRIALEDGTQELVYDVFYDKAIKWGMREAKLPDTVLRFILSGKVHSEVTRRTAKGTTRTEYTI